MERERILLIQKTFRTLNTYYYRNHNMNSSSSVPPLAVQRVKVTFKDEPGEGSGVARSFYASIVEVDRVHFQVSSSCLTMLINIHVGIISGHPIR
jgi:hypothetical protein